MAVVGMFLLVPAAAHAADLVLPKENVYFSNNKPLSGEVVRIYATVANASQNDVRARVRFSVSGVQVGEVQPITVLAAKSSTVFVDWTPSEGYYPIEVSVINPDIGDENQDNNTANMVDFIVDLDTDSDGIFDSIDMDDDNDGVEDGLERIKGSNPLKTDTDGDGVNDGVDEFPNDPAEKYDNDKDGIGNNTDPDNDNDGVLNGDDPAPFDPLISRKESPPEPKKSKPVATPEKIVAAEPLPAPVPEPEQPQEPEYTIEDVTYTFPNADEAVYTIDVSIAKSRTSWNTYAFDVLGGDPTFLYLWDFGDGNYAQNIDTTHTFPGSGEYSVTLSVTDAAGGLGTATEHISIGFWNIGNFTLKLVVGVLSLFGVVLAGYLIRQTFFERKKPSVS